MIVGSRCTPDSCHPLGLTLCGGSYINRVASWTFVSPKHLGAFPTISMYRDMLQLSLFKLPGQHLAPKDAKSAAKAKAQRQETLTQ